MKKNKRGKPTLGNVVREGFSEEVIFKLRPEIKEPAGGS